MAFVTQRQVQLHPVDGGSVCAGLPAHSLAVFVDMAALLHISYALQAVERSLQEAVALSTSQAAPLLSVPWGLHFIANASSSALLTNSKALLQSVRFWKAANAVASTAGLARSSHSSNRGRPVLMARVLNHQNSLKEKQQQQRKDGPSAGGAAGSSGAGVSATIKACAQTASILSRCVHCFVTVLLWNVPRWLGLHF
jgi:hypothetical protein